jgi:hypothetical protein
MQHAPLPPHHYQQQQQVLLLLLTSGVGQQMLPWHLGQVLLLLARLSWPALAPTGSASAASPAQQV